MFRKMQRIYDPAYLPTVSMQDLYETVYPSRPPIIDGLLYAGTYLFVGAPKVGKSFLMAQIGYHVSTGLELWGYPVHQGAVLYLALEDDHRRLQDRLFRMFGTESADNLYFSIYAKQLGAGLEEQLKWFVQEHPDTRLIIIDTLQKVREPGGDTYSYASDYEVIAKLKAFADEHSICLLLVHHTRKQQAEDKFDMISGTNGLLGAADGAFLLQKERRTSNTATLDISGHFRTRPAGSAPLLDPKRRTADMDTGASGNRIVERTAGPGTGGDCGTGDSRTASMERNGNRTRCRSGTKDETQRLLHAAQCPCR